MSEPPNNNPLPPRGNPVLDGTDAPFSIAWYKALQRTVQNAGGGITQLTGDVLAGPGGGVQNAQLNDTGVTPGSYTNTNLTVGADGRLTHAEDGSTALTQAGFGFEAFGLLADNEFLGFASWPVDVTFANNTDSYLVAFPTTPATSDAVFRFVDEALTVQATATVAAGDRIGTIVWTALPTYVHPAYAPLLIYGPTPTDATLANVNSLIVGTVA